MKRNLIILLLAILCPSCVAVQAMPEPFVSPLSYAVFVPLIRSYRARDHGAGMTVGDCGAAEALGLKWTHGWALNPTICPGVEAVPQISRLWQIGQPLGGNSQYVIFLNEPEEPGQSDVPDPVDAGEGLVLAMSTYSNKDFVLPSGTYDYLDRMLAAAGDVPRDRLVANGHCYGWGELSTALARCRNHVNGLLAWAERNGIDEVWITEFGLDPAWYGGMDASMKFVREMPIYYRLMGVDRWAVFQVNSTAGQWSTGEMGLWVGGRMTKLGAAYQVSSEW